ncbi:hypothetical protein M7I_7955 [Glarea lozoyensis 74030]|uniref:Uncharacterized protein n=1 Tax=Glarea lozoyensis (strain ATCC 74030 / MF5533) TaxID=1104152 RepID=H0EYP8_GLAL7|nr:hypothetical protein M7I_7955 [Glarea lozoyensis 74030]
MEGHTIPLEDRLTTGGQMMKWHKTNKTSDHPYKTWGTCMLEAGNNAGMSFDVGPYIKQRLEDAGFINVVEKKVCCTIETIHEQPGAAEVSVFGARMRAAVKNNRLLAHHWFIDSR